MSAATPKPPASPKAEAAPKRAVALAAVQPDPEPEQDDADAAGTRTLRLKELVERVMASTGGKKKDTREIVEATLAELGLALGKGEMLNLPDFGKLRVARAQGSAPGSAMTLKLRPTGKAARKNSGEGPLAEPADQG